jgi:uncharacterized glyoxalase superfamily protein PhnB
MGGLDLRAKEIMTFVPAGKDFRITLEFYKDLGFDADWESEDLAILRKDNCRFFLQKLDNEEMRNNFMMNLEVENLDDWWKKIQATGVQEKYPGTRLVPPKDYPWGKREIHLIGPDGVLWHIAASAQATLV